MLERKVARQMLPEINVGRNTLRNLHLSWKHVDAPEVPEVINFHVYYPMVMGPGRGKNVLYYNNI